MRIQHAWNARVLGAAMLILPALAHGQFYRQVNLVSDGSVPALHTDTNLVNAWGLATGPTTPFWISDNGSGMSSIYNGAGATVLAPVTIPPPGSATPTGIVFNGGSGFTITNGTTTAPARFIWVTEDGTVAGWNPGVDPANAIPAADNSFSGAVYKGAALAHSGLGTFLYATNFNSGMVDVFDSHFHMIGSFSDSHLPMHYAPFGIANIDGFLVVTFALQDAHAHDDVPGPGHGFVDVFSPSGTLLRRFAARGTLNSPWGISLAPHDFGRFEHALLIGNFGDGRINAFNIHSGAFLGQLQASHGNPITIDGLWALLPGNGHAGGDLDKLYFTAGPNGEANGLFGSLQAVHH